MNPRTRDEVIQVLKDSEEKHGFRTMPWGISCLGYRDINRLLKYLSYEEAVECLGDVFKEGVEENWEEAQTWNAENIEADMRRALDFAFEKAIGQRGISASLMHTVMTMWLWVIQDQDLLDECYYTNYGLPDLYRIRDKHFPDLEVHY